jgi:hypothetical protein
MTKGGLTAILLPWLLLFFALSLGLRLGFDAGRRAVAETSRKSRIVVEVEADSTWAISVYSEGAATVEHTPGAAFSQKVTRWWRESE